MGARPEDYELSSPQKSYIHVDEFKDAKELADYLHLLDKNDGEFFFLMMFFLGLLWNNFETSLTKFQNFCQYFIYFQ